jgi:branched-chain amino acid transport system substrate-binding protein
MRVRVLSGHATRAGVGFLVGVAVLLGAGCDQSRLEPVRIGILSDCYGFFSGGHELAVASAELPLLERGGELRGRQPSSGVEGAEVAGRPVELLFGCVAGNDDVIPEARRLVEEDGAQAIVGPLDPQQGLILRDYARRRPETAFLVQPSASPELTLTDAAPNVFRFAVNSSQWVAGAGTYAFRDLGWRTAAIVGDDAPFSWQQAAGFVAEFCALGGRIVDRTWITVGTDPAAVVPKLMNTTDGVFLAPTVSPMVGLLKAYARLHPDVSRRLVSSTTLLYDPTVLPVATGVVAAGPLPFAPTPATTAYVRAFARAFPTIPPTAAVGPVTIAYRDGVEALLGALEHTRAKTGKTLLDVLARTRLDSASGQIRLDRNRQAVGSTYLSRVVTDAKRNRVIETLRVVSEVEQTFGGYFTPGDPPPSRTSPACRRGTPPAWAR